MYSVFSTVHFTWFPPPSLLFYDRTNVTMSGSSLQQNPPNAGRNITAGGSDWLWAVFAVMLLADLGMIALAFMVSASVCVDIVRAQRRVPHLIAAERHTVLP